MFETIIFKTMSTYNIYVYKVERYFVLTTPPQTPSAQVDCVSETVIFHPVKKCLSFRVLVLVKEGLYKAYPAISFALLYIS